ncbi:MAG: hypothetical protein J6S78_01310 [Lachnospiraceae bacterium]|nr:hypothetical protein [Lachnospiraceae bacterium]
MKYRYKRVTVVLLTICLVLSFCPGYVAFAEGESVTASSRTTPVYYLVKEEAAGRWLTKYNWIHDISVNGVTYPAYCVESMWASPTEGTVYHEIDAAAMRYSDTTMAGLREILRNGYPYTTRICGIDFGTDTVKAQATTQVAVRMWVSYRKEQENASYYAFPFWNPEPKRGSALVKAGTDPGAREVYDASIALFRLAKSGVTSTIETAFDVQTIRLPERSTDDAFAITLTLSLTNCEYATLAFSEAGAQILTVSKGSAERIENGAVVTVRLPASAAGRTLTISASGYSTKAASSLRFYAEDTGRRQRLFVGRTDLYGVTVRAKNVNVPTLSPTPKPNPVKVSKRAVTSASSSSPEEETAELKELKGARLQILDKNRKVIFEWVTDGKEKELNAVLIAGETYILHEVEAPPGYILAEDQTFTVGSDGSISKVVMEDKPTRVEISKKSALDGSLLAGAKLQIYDGTQLVYEWVTDGKKHTLVGKLTAGKKYRLHEAEAPAGYLVAEDVTFTVGTTGEWDRVEMTDYYTRVVISKVSLTNGKEVAGAALSLTDESGAEIASWVTDGMDTVITAELKAGVKYTLTETEAPKGYLKAEPVTFRYGEDNSTVVMKDPPTVFVTSKKDRDTELPLPGAQMQILDMTGNVIEEWVSNGTDHRTVATLEAGERYVLHEVQAPKGYKRGADVFFTMPEKQETEEIVFYNVRTKIPSVRTGDNSAHYVLYGIFGFLGAVNFGILGHRFRKRRA